MKYNIDEILESNSYGKYKIITHINKKSYEIEFLKTGFKKKVNESDIKRGSVTDNSAMKCDICGDVNNGIYVSKKFNAILCKTHYRQAKDRNSLDKVNKPTMFDKNEIVINEEHNYAEIIIRNKNNEEVARAIIDIDKIEVVKDTKWRFANNRIKGANGIELHKLLMGNPNSIVDHADRNTLNNRMSNLRIATAQQNVINSSLAKNNLSGFIGVSTQKSKNTPYVAELMFNRQKVFRKSFSNKEDAIKARLKAELEYFGEEFAPQRHLFKEYGIVI